MNVIREVKSFIQSKRIFYSGDSVLIGISGGADSTALVLILNELKHELGISIYLAHFNHALRETADQDQRFVEGLASDLNLRIFSQKTKINLKELKGSLEDHAREARMNFLISCAQQNSIQKIALAHHQDDLAETVLMKIIRGSGMQGLKAIRPSRVLNQMTFVRPLLCLQKVDIENYLKDKKQSFCEDDTNQDVDFFRNRIRHELLPLLKSNYNSNVVQVLSNLSEISSEDYEYLEQTAQRNLQDVVESQSDCEMQLSMEKFLSLHKSLQRLVLRSAFQHLKGDLNQIDFSHAEEVMDLIVSRPDGSIVHLPENISIQKHKKIFNITLTKT